MIVNFVDCQSLLISNAMLKQVEKWPVVDLLG